MTYVSAGVLLFAIAAVAGSAKDTPEITRPRAETVRCTNPSSGATWQIRIDYDKRTVDSFPATISKLEINWQDPQHGGYYSLDRRSGELIVRFASSTGGFSLRDTCALIR